MLSPDVKFKAKMHQNQFRLGKLYPRPCWGSLQCYPRPPSWNKGDLLLGERVGTGKKKRRRGRGKRKREEKREERGKVRLTIPIPEGLHAVAKVLHCEW